MDCGRCGVAASPGDAFCRSCGAGLVVPAPVEPPSPDEDEPSQRLQLAVGITIAIVVLATIIGIVIRDTGGDELQLATLTSTLPSTPPATIPETIPTPTATTATTPVPPVTTVAEIDVTTTTAPVAITTTLHPVPLGDKWGYIDSVGATVIDARFDNALAFSEGLGAVMTGTAWGYVDSSGAVAIEPQFGSAGPFVDGLALVSGPTGFGYIDRTGAAVIPQQFELAGDFGSGLAPVVVGGLWGYIDTAGALVLAGQYDWAEPFSEGLAPVQVGALWGYIDTSANMVIAPSFEAVSGFGVDGSARRTARPPTMVLVVAGGVVDAETAGFSISSVGCNSGITSDEVLACSAAFQRTRDDVGTLVVVWRIDGMVASETAAAGAVSGWALDRPAPGDHTVTVLAYDPVTNYAQSGAAPALVRPGRNAAIPPALQALAAGATVLTVGAWLWLEMLNRTRTAVEALAAEPPERTDVPYWMTDPRSTRRDLGAGGCDAGGRARALAGRLGMECRHRGPRPPQHDQRLARSPAPARTARPLAPPGLGTRPEPQSEGAVDLRRAQRGECLARRSHRPRPAGAADACRRPIRASHRRLPAGARVHRASAGMGLRRRRLAEHGGACRGRRSARRG